MADKFKKESYLASGGTYCPYCGASYIEATGNTQFTGGSMTETIICRECDREWADIWTLTGVKETHDE